MHQTISAALTTLLVLALSSGIAAGLNDTGITGCANDTAVVTTAVAADGGTHPRQDCRYGRDAAATVGMPKDGGGGKGFDFTKIANNGTPLPANAVLGSAAAQWACTKDNVTGLVWEVKTTSGLRSQSHTYTWYTSNPATHGGVTGTPSGGACATAGHCDTEKFAADVNTGDGLCGAKDWRMPTKKELLSLVDYGRASPTSPAIDPTYFPNTPAANYWTSLAHANGLTNAWYVGFGNGNADYTYIKSNPFPVRLVRTVP